MPTPPRRRWYQVSLSTILVALVIIALAVVAAKERVQRVWLQGEVERLRQEAASRYPDILLMPPEARANRPNS